MWQRLPLIIILTAVVCVALWFYNFSWSGFGAYTDPTGDYTPVKTLWDWLGLLIIPVFLALGGIWINVSVRQIERERDEKHAETERKIADDRLKEQTLQTYFDRTSDMLLKNQFNDSAVREQAKVVARARTLTVLRGLEGERKSALIRFLSEANLITDDESPAIDLTFADMHNTDLSGVQLRHLTLIGAILTGANLLLVDLEGADLSSADLTGVNLEMANLSEAEFQGASLIGANFEFATLKETNLSANLTGAKITSEQLAHAILDEHTILPDGTHWKSTADPSQDTSQ